MYKRYKNATISNPEVSKLANQIIEAQEREIAEMKSMLKSMEK